MADHNKNVVQVSFKNSLDQHINPGDKVVVITSGYNKDINIREGVYLGRYKTETGGAVCMVNRPSINYRLKSTGEEDQRNNMWQRIRESNKPTPPHVRYNSPEYADYIEACKLIRDENARMTAQIKSEYEEYKVPHWHRTTLQRNRVYKGYTMVWDMKI